MLFQEVLRKSLGDIGRVHYIEWFAGLGVDDHTLFVWLKDDQLAPGVPPADRLSVICDTWIAGPVPAVTRHP